MPNCPTCEGKGYTELSCGRGEARCRCNDIAALEAENARLKEERERALKFAEGLIRMCICGPGYNGVCPGCQARKFLASMRPEGNGEEESANESFERVAAEFERETGYMAPGKSVPLACAADPEYDFDVRMEKWNEWTAKRRQPADEKGGEE